MKTKYNSLSQRLNLPHAHRLPLNNCFMISRLILHFFQKTFFDFVDTIFRNPGNTWPCPKLEGIMEKSKFSLLSSVYLLADVSALWRQFRLFLNQKSNYWKLKRLPSKTTTQSAFRTSGITKNQLLKNKPNNFKTFEKINISGQNAEFHTQNSKVPGQQPTQLFRLQLRAFETSELVR